jgi:hypothetical protein
MVRDNKHNLREEINMKRCSQIFLLVLFSLFLVVSSVWGQNLHVLVNIWDGTEMPVVENLYDRGKLPFLSSIGPLYNLSSNEDCFDGTCMKTLTKPQHATMLTGCLADVHGVYTNNNFQLIPDGITVYEIIEASNSEYKTAHVSGKPLHFGLPTFGNIVTDVDFFEAGISPSMATDTVINLIDLWKDNSFFIVCHFKNPDAIGHKYGIDSRQYRRAIKQDDTQLGSLLATLDANKANAETIVYVLADHGFGCPKPTNHPCSPNTFITSNNVNLTGDLFMNDVAGFLLSHFDLTPVCQ